MIETTGTVIIGDESLDNCPSLRFVGSRAYCGYMVNGYDPVVKDNHYSSAYNNYYFYVPTDNIGYSSHCTSFTAESGVADYELVDIMAAPICCMAWTPVRKMKTETVHRLHLGLHYAPAKR